MPKHVVVLGASGNIGSKLAENLLAQGHTVTAVARHADKLSTLEKKGATLAVGDILAPGFLEGLFAKADAVFTLIPPNGQHPDVLAYQDEVGERIANALKAQPVAEVVALSSQGANHTDKRLGPIRGVSRQEERLNSLGLPKLLHLRPTYFMENLLANVPSITGQGAVYSPFPAEVPMNMIATRDIAEFAAQALNSGLQPGNHAHVLLGPRTYTNAEATRIVGAAVGKPDAQYVQVPVPAAVEAMKGFGLSESMASLYGEMFDGAMQDGIFSQDTRTPDNTTPTTLEQFAQAALGSKN